MANERTPAWLSCLCPHPTFHNKAHKQGERPPLPPGLHLSTTARCRNTTCGLYGDSGKRFKEDVGNLVGPQLGLSHVALIKNTSEHPFPASRHTSILCSADQVPHNSCFSVTSPFSCQLKSMSPGTRVLGQKLLARSNHPHKSQTTALLTATASLPRQRIGLANLKTPQHFQEQNNPKNRS